MGRSQLLCASLILMLIAGGGARRLVRSATTAADGAVLMTVGNRASGTSVGGKATVAEDKSVTLDFVFQEAYPNLVDTDAKDKDGKLIQRVEFMDHLGKGKVIIPTGQAVIVPGIQQFLLDRKKTTAKPQIMVIVSAEMKPHPKKK